MTREPDALAVLSEERAREAAEAVARYMPELQPRQRQSRYEASKSRTHVRRVRSPRFTDAEWAEIAKQAARLTSSESVFWARRQMTAHEFVRVAAVAVAKAMQEMPRGSKPPPIWELLRELPSNARHDQVARNAPAGKQQQKRSASPTRSTKRAKT